MLYPFMTLNDNTEITHSELLPDGRVRVNVERPVNMGFHSAVCMLPSYEWEDVKGFSEGDLSEFREIIESTAHLIMEYSQTGGFENASGF